METDRRGSYGLEGEAEAENARATSRTDAYAASVRELGDGISQIGVFTEDENHRNLGLSNYLPRGSARSPSSLIAKDFPKEYQLTKDEFEFTKDYLNKDFRRYDLPDINALNDLYQKLDYERLKKDLDVRKLSKVEVDRLRKSLFSEGKVSEYYGEKTVFKKPDYIIKNSEFLQKSNELLSKITKERNYKKTDGVRDIDNRLVSDYRKVVKDSIGNEFGVSKDELSLQNFGSIRLRTGSLSRSYDDSDRLRHEVEGVRSSKHHLDSESRHEEEERNAEGISAYTKGIANLLAGYTRSERSAREPEVAEREDSATTPTCSSPTMYHHSLPHSPNLNLRQSSPYPVDGPAPQTGPNNQQRHKNQHGYQHKKKPSLRTNEKNEKNEKNSGFPGQREHPVGLGTREHSSGTLTSRGRVSSRRHQQANGMLSSTSSNSSISDPNDDYHDVDHRRLNLENDLNGDSPPEPAPPEVPPRGPSLHITGNTHTLRGSRSANDRTPQGQDIFLSEGKFFYLLPRQDFN